MGKFLQDSDVVDILEYTSLATSKTWIGELEVSKQVTYEGRSSLGIQENKFHELEKILRISSILETFNVLENGRL